MLLNIYTLKLILDSTKVHNKHLLTLEIHNIHKYNVWKLIHAFSKDRYIDIILWVILNGNILTSYWYEWITGIG